MVQAGHGLPPRRRRAQDGYRAVDGAGDRGAGAGGCERRQSRQGRAGGPCRQRLGFPAESQGKRNTAD